MHRAIGERSAEKKIRTCQESGSLVTYFETLLSTKGVQRNGRRSMPPVAARETAT
jgi:hypothetical protein